MKFPLEITIDLTAMSANDKRALERLATAHETLVAAVQALLIVTFDREPHTADTFDALAMTLEAAHHEVLGHHR